MQNNLSPVEISYAPLSEDAAHRRIETWSVLHESGASLLWHPIASDKALNASESKRVSSIKSAAAAAIKGEPVLHDDMSVMLAAMNGNLENSPFWFSFVRPSAIRCIPVSFRADGGLVDQCVDEMWGEMCRIERTYAPVGIDGSGETRPHFYYQYLRVCLRSAVHKISRLCLAASGMCIDDPLSPEHPDPNAMAPEVGIENRECRDALEKAMQGFRHDPRLERVFDLLVIRGLSLREAGVILSSSKSSIQRDAEALVVHIHGVFSEYYGCTTQARPDVTGVLSAMRSLFEDTGRIPDFSGATKRRRHIDSTQPPTLTPISGPERFSGFLGH